MTALTQDCIEGRIRSVTRYEPPRPPQPIDLRLDANESAPPPAGWIAKVVGEVTPGISRYTTAQSFEQELAGAVGVDPARIVVTAGADDALERICRCTLGPGRTLLLPTPTFEMMSRYARLAGGMPAEVPWNDGPFPLQQFLSRLDERTGLIYVASPNNPTGLALDPDDLASLARAAGSTPFVLDLAYTEFADVDLLPLALSLPNVIITRTLSKAWGLAGLRVGYAIAPAELASDLRRVGQPYAVSSLSMSIARRWITDGADRVTERISRVREERTVLARILRGLGGDPIESAANFILCRFGNAPLVADLLAGCGIGVRRFPPDSPLGDSLRITCPGDPAAFERLADSLHAAMRPEAILFDMDGVLADVSRSYRRAVIATAQSFGVRVTEADVAAEKSLPNSNNDWNVTHRLLAARGVSATLDEVTGRFEAIYQGSGSAAPLWQEERLLIGPELLQTLAARLPLGIVTGRPRRDAERFLRTHGIEQCFRVLVCMEDAPLKPDPAPLIRALSLLNIRHAWYLGDTPDDVAAARAAHVVPIGCVSPSDQPTDASRILLTAGAGRVLRDVGTLLEILP